MNKTNKSNLLNKELGKWISFTMWLPVLLHTIVSNTNCLVLISVVKKYLSGYKNKTHCKLQVVRVKNLLLFVWGRMREQHRHESFSVIWVFPWHQWALVQDSVEACEVPKRHRNQQEIDFFFLKDYAPCKDFICSIHFYHQTDSFGDQEWAYFILRV